MNESDEIKRQRLLIAALSALLTRLHGSVECFETHISWVLVAGEFAYKFKKAVRFDFLDFSTLQARQFYCQEEVRLNRRLAPQLYLNVQAIGGSAVHPSFEQGGKAIEYCVRMRAFEQQALWSWRLQQRLISGGEIDALAEEAARFHLGAAVALANVRWGDPEVLQQIAQDNDAVVGQLVRGEAAIWAQHVQEWGAGQRELLKLVFLERKRGGFIRECHGDLHSRNIVTIDDRVEAFDCIEFNESLRWIDVINDFAFICMDLQFQGRPELAARCLNRYLEVSGDYDAVRVLRYYLVQRALVRSKVALLRGQQAGASADDAAACEHEGWRYLAHAFNCTAAVPPALMITHGFSGSGKSVFSRLVVECAGALQLRSDVERKRLHGIAPGQRDGQGLDLYSVDATQRTYRRLIELSRTLIESGMSVIVDAAFLRQSQRHDFSMLADALGVPFVIFDLRASEATMRARLSSREREGQDASDAGIHVLEHQLQNHDPLSDEDLVHTIVVDAESNIEPDAVQRLCTHSRKLQTIRGSGRRTAGSN